MKFLRSIYICPVRISLSFAIMKRLFLFILLNCSFLLIIQAQETLPKISVTELGSKVLISWKNPFTNVTNIVVQRSADSAGGFKTIGSVINITATSNGFVDQQPFTFWKGYYRLFITLSGGTYIFTEALQPTLDTTSTEKTAFDNPTPVQTWFVPSPYIYTDKKNQVVLSLPNATNKKYSVKFFDTSNELIFELKKVPLDYLIIEKSNFVHSGLFHFEIYDNRILINRDKVYIPKDGKPMPLLDINGNEIN